jgi:hypothetical protein
MAAGRVVVWLMGGFWGKSADTNVTEDHEHLRDHEPLRMRANWWTAVESKRECGGGIEVIAEEDETGRTPSCAQAGRSVCGCRERREISKWRGFQER